MNLLRYVRVFRRGLLLIVITALIGAAIGVAIGTFTNRTAAAHKTQTYYHAAHRFGLDPVAAAHAPSTELSNLNSIAQLTDDPAVTSAIGAKLHGDGVALARRITTVVSSNPDTLVLDAVATTSAQAVRLAEASATALLATYGERLTTAAANQGNQLAQRLADLKTRRAG